MKKWIILRRIAQGTFLILFTYILWSTTYPLKGPIPPKTFFILNPLIMLVTSISERVILAAASFSILILALSLIFGRFFCGWICPLGAIIDMAGALRKTFPLQDSINKKLRSPKFFIFGFILIFSILGIQIAWVLDPMGIMARFISLNLIPAVTFAIDKSFELAIKTFQLYGPVYDFYRGLKSSFLGVNVYYFAHSALILLSFLFITGSALLVKRFWCRAICPLGAIYAIVSKFSLFRRVVSKCAHCDRCRSGCRMGAISDDLSYTKAECILCMDCVYDCPQNITRFSFPSFRGIQVAVNTQDKNSRGTISRRSFIFLLSISLPYVFGFVSKKRSGIGASREDIIRPPASLREEKFLNRCVRCGNCMKVCITNGLQPMLFQGGLSGIWTPQLVPEIGYCEYHCTLCGNVCPTGAIPPLSREAKIRVRLGIARINRTLCLPWAEQKECIVCEEHCPVYDKAIKLEKEMVNDKVLSRPHVGPSLCIGCGICQNKCPVRPVRAVRVFSIGADRA